MIASLAPDERDALRHITTPAVCNAIETFGVRPRNEGFMDSTVACRSPGLGPMGGVRGDCEDQDSRATRGEVP